MQPADNSAYTITETELLDRIRKYNQQKSMRQAKVVCYTAIDAGDDNLIIPETIIDEWDYVVFTNKTVQGEHVFDVCKYPGPQLTSGYLKTHPHILFPQYEYSIWLDPGILVRGRHLRDTIDKCFRDHISIMLSIHPRYQTIQDRFESCLQSQKMSYQLAEKQMLKYYAEGLPETAKFYKTGLVIRQHMTREIIEANEAWWNEIKNGIRKDELSLPYVVWKYQLKPGLMIVKFWRQNNLNNDYSLFQNKLYCKKNVPEYVMPSFLKIIHVPDEPVREKGKMKSNKVVNSRIDFIGIQRKLYRHGFIERAYNELIDIFKNAQSIHSKQKAAWNLAFWHANKGSAEDARICLEFIEIAISLNKKAEKTRRAAIFKAECYKKLDELEKADKVLTDALKQGASADLFLAMGNLSNTAEQKIYWLNKVYELYHLSRIELLRDKKWTDFERLAVKIDLGKQMSEYPKNVLVTVLISTYNAQSNIHIALDSILNQTWKNIEIIVVDDCSTDETLLILESYLKRDKRIKLIRLTQNQGTYVARNTGLKKSSGEFITCHDSDDWSHPQKIEIQVRHLLKNNKIIANTSQHIRVTHDLTPFRRGNSGIYIQTNYSSVMFRRKEVLEGVGYWDSVRFGADSEMIFRIKSFFGAERFVNLKTGPLMLALQSEKSLTGDKFFGINGFPTGARAEYRDSLLNYHENSGELYFDFPMIKRKFAVPEPMRPIRETTIGKKRHFDIIFAYDFRVKGDITDDIAREILSKYCFNQRTGLAQLCSYEVSVKDYPAINSNIRQLINDEKAQLIVFGEQVSCDLLIIKHPAILMDYQQFIPEIEAQDIIIENGNEPRRTQENVFNKYDRKTCEQNILKYFNKKGKWISDEKPENA